MKAVLDFLHAALPWIAMGLLLAVFFARSGRKKRDETQKDNYGLEGMCLGMAFGSAIGISIGNQPGIGICLGMFLGLVIGTGIKKKRADDDKKE